MRILMENMQALNINHRQDDYLLSSSSSLKDSGYQGRSIRKSESILNLFFFSLEDLRSNYTPQTYRSNQSQSNATESSDVC